MSYPRYRTRGGLVKSGQVQTWRQWNTCAESAWTLLGTYGGPYLGTKSLMYDYVVPNFEKKRKRGDVFFNPMYSETRTITSSGGTGCVIKAKNYPRMPCNQYYGYKITGDYFAKMLSADPISGVSPQQLIVEEDIEDLSDELSTCVHSKRERTDSNLWESMYELDKSAKLLRQLGTRAYKLTGLLGGSAQAGQIAKEWLAFRYGVKPIIRDIENVVKAMRKQVSRVRHTSRCFNKIQEERTDYGSYDHDSVRDTYYILRKDVVVIRAMSLDEWSSSFLTDIGISSKGLLTLPWEILPYSFVADWFANVGDFLNAVAPTFSTKQLGSALVVERHVSASFVCTGTSEADGTFRVISPTSGGLTSVVDSKQRAALNPPTLKLKRDFRFRNLERAADAMALVANALLRKQVNKPLQSIQF